MVKLLDLNGSNKLLPIFLEDVELTFFLFDLCLNSFFTIGTFIDILHNNDMKQILDTLSQTVVNIATQASSTGKLTKW